MRAMILAAGLGTRLKPFTDTKPKALAPINGKTVLQRNVEWLQQYGILDVIVNVHHFATQIIDVIEENKGWGSRIVISNESDEVLETGGGIKKAAWFLAESDACVVMNADILTDFSLKEMINFHELNLPLVTLATSERETSRYLLFAKKNTEDSYLSLCGWKNVKTGEQKGMDGVPMAFSGIQILSASIFEKITFTGKFSMIDVYLQLCNQNNILSFDHSASKLIDIGTVAQLEKAAGMFQ